MRIHSRDWIAWSLVAAILVVATVEYVVQTQTGMSSSDYVYKIVVTPQSSTN